MSLSGHDARAQNQLSLRIILVLEGLVEFDAVSVVGSVAEFKQDVLVVDVDAGGDLVLEEEGGGFFGRMAGDFAGLEVVAKVPAVWG